MASLHRIIMVQGHLKGVVELDLQGHSNMCGDNRSGKTTLQRLIPVFYGEHPNKVVPKTRDKFDRFYLPTERSYLVYEYSREQGDICMVVLTHKANGEGVCYRFVASPYLPELFLDETEQGWQAISYQELVPRLKRYDIDSSVKIDTVSGYRSVIQNFPENNAALSRKDNNTLRQLAMRYGLASGSHRLRHVEKLVSAVHAKEGKIETLKTLLAAIFEEDGVALPITRIRRDEVQQWVQQIRQTRRLDQLEKQLAQLNNRAQQLEHYETLLWRLQPALLNDDESLKQLIADTEQQCKQCERRVEQADKRYNEERRTIQGELSQTKSDYDKNKASLDAITHKYEGYENKQTAELEHAFAQLPNWRAQKQESIEQKRQLEEGIDDIKGQFNAQRYEKTEELRVDEALIREEIDDLRQALDDMRLAYDSDREATQRQQEQSVEQERGRFNDEQLALKTQIIEFEAQCKGTLLSVAEQAELARARGRIDSYQAQLDAHNDSLGQLAKQWQQCEEERQNGLLSVDKQKRHFRDADLEYQYIVQQLEPKAGSLRAFLEEQYSGWQFTIGKVIREDLLERSNLSPELGVEHTQLMGLKLDTSVIEVAPYAQDNEQLQLARESANQQLQQAKETLDTLEKQQRKFNQAVNEAEQQQQIAKQKQRQMQDELQQAKAAYTEQQEGLEYNAQRRREKLKQEIQALEQQLETLEKQHQANLAAIKEEYGDLLLEKSADWQERQQHNEAKQAQLEQRLERRKTAYDQAMQHLQDLYDQELSQRGLNPAVLLQLENTIRQLTKNIKSTEARREEWWEYQRFIEEEWQQRKPKLVDKEFQLSQEIRQIEQHIQQLKEQFNHEEKQLKDELAQLRVGLTEAQQQRQHIEPILRRITSLSPPKNIAAEAMAVDENLDERIAKAQHALQQQNDISDALNSALGQFETAVLRDADDSFIQSWQQFSTTTSDTHQGRLATLNGMLKLLADRRQNLINQGRNFGQDLSNFFDVFHNVNRHIQTQSQRLSSEVSEELELEDIKKSDVRILSSIDEFGFWEPLKHYAKLHKAWQEEFEQLPSEDYLIAISDVADLLRSDQKFSFENLIRIELILNEGGKDLLIRNDRQLLEASSHGMAYLILCKYLLAFARLLRGEAEVTLHWPVDELGTLAYRNVERLFRACDNNRIYIVGAFPNAESDVLTLFKQRYLIEKRAGGSQLKRIEPKLSRLSQMLRGSQG